MLNISAMLSTVIETCVPIITKHAICTPRIEIVIVLGPVEKQEKLIRKLNGMK